jgi:hypothetical protein
MARNLIPAPGHSEVEMMARCVDRSYLLMFMLSFVSSCGTPGAPIFPESYSSVTIQRESIGYDSPISLIDQGVVTFNDSDAEFSGSIFVDTWDGYCAGFCPFGPITMTTEEVEELRSRIADVPEKNCHDPLPGNECEEEDRGTVATLTVGDTESDDYCCGNLNRSYENAFGDVLSFLDSLAVQHL